MQLIRRSRNACFRRPLRDPLLGAHLDKAKSLAFLMLGAIFTNFGQSLVSAQIIPDMTLGTENSVVNSNVELNQELVDLIEGGAIRDANLFHSFEQFNLTGGQNVYFANPAGIENILTRITGTDTSNILGTLGVEGAANLFLLNPNGIMFGPNAQLDISGSFVASTADSIVFNDGLEFSATNPEVPPLLTINVPLGLQYGAKPGNINLERTSASQPDLDLTVTPGKTIALVGGDLNLQRADLEAPGGRIELGSIAGEGLVSLTSTAEGGWKLGYEKIASFGDIQTTRSFISTSIEEETATEFPLQSSDGTIALRAASLDIGRSSVIRTNSFTDFSGGDIEIEVRNLTIRDGAGVSARTFSNAPGGNIIVNASEKVEIKDSLNFGQFVFLSSLSTTTGGTQNQGGIGKAANL
ncbi:MAG: filamentous hemagglutinin N-terminal domain-containing protein, partial [Cyanobacteria bacterium J06638_38]